MRFRDIVVPVGRAMRGGGLLRVDVEQIAGVDTVVAMHATSVSILRLAHAWPRLDPVPVLLLAGAARRRLVRETTDAF
jgi:hypothetical protein